MADLIGTGRCPVGCGSEKARYTLSSKMLAVATCNACNCQVFARSDRSDEVLRANIRPAANDVPAPVAAPAQEAFGGPVSPEDKKPPAPLNQYPKPHRPGFGLGAFGAST